MTTGFLTTITASFCTESLTATKDISKPHSKYKPIVSLQSCP